MFINTLMLSILSSFDSMGIGITYGLRRTKFSFFSRVVFFVVSFVSTTFSILLGNFIKDIFSPNFTAFLGNILIIGIGFFIVLDSFRNCNDFDFDNSNDINMKEALVLSFSLSLDSLCIGIGASMLGINTFLFPFFVSFLQLVFLLVGDFLGKNLVSISKVPHSVWNFISGFLLIAIGVCKFL